LKESSLLRSVERELKRRGVTYRKRHGGVFSVKGDPDLYGCAAGRHWEIELKRPGEEPTELQRARLEEWGRAGAKTGVVKSLEELRIFLEQLYT